VSERESSTKQTSELQFETATYEKPESHASCQVCRRRLGAAYWQWIGRMVCEKCRSDVAMLEANARRGKTFARALGLGGAAAIGGGVGYAIFVKVTNIQLALVTIGIGWLVAKAIRKVTKGFGGVRFQVLAVALTYVGASMGYAPAVFEALSNARTHAPATASSASSSTAKSPGIAPVSVAPEGSVSSADQTAPSRPPSPRHASPLGAIIALVLLAGLVIAAPVLTIAQAPIGALIVVFGLYQAWKMTKSVSSRVEGPFDLSKKDDVAA
jgi:hypothetical protein